jgi:very-short-patch-repair endonuclease
MGVFLPYKNTILFYKGSSMQAEHIYIVTFVFMILILAVLAKFVLSQKKIDDEATISSIALPFAKKPILNKNEREFFWIIQKALPQEHFLNIQTSLASFLKPLGHEQVRLKSKISKKYTDFVVLNKYLDIVCIIEIDDRKPELEKDVERDLIFNAAGYNIIRYDAKMKPTIDKIRADILKSVEELAQENT